MSQASRTAKQASAATRFEAALAELEQVVEQLELGRLGLDEAVRLFERGSQLVATCRTILDQTELRVTRLAAEAATPLSDAPTPQA